MNCRECRSPLDDDARYCSRCGAAVNDSESTRRGDAGIGEQTPKTTPIASGTSRSEPHPRQRRFQPATALLSSAAIVATVIFALAMVLRGATDRSGAPPRVVDTTTRTPEVALVLAPTPTVTVAPLPTTTPTPAPIEADLIRRLLPSVARVETDQGSGTAFSLRHDGDMNLFVTNAHVIVGADSVEIVLADGVTHPARVLARDEDLDLAILGVKGLGGVTPLRLGDSDDLSPGTPLYVIGFALGSTLGNTPTVTRGIVSGRPTFHRDDFIQTDAAMNPGTSGGPVVNRLGEVVGVATHGIVGHGIQSIHFAIPSKTVERAFDRLLAWGTSEAAQTGNIWAALANDLPLSTSIDIGDLEPFQKLSALSALRDQVVVWTGSEVITWGAFGGARFDPTTNRWTAISTENSPPLPERRSSWTASRHSAVWTGEEMVVWDGSRGGRFHPGRNTWRLLPTLGAPVEAFYHTAVWTGTEMIIWDGSRGARYVPAADRWLSMSEDGAPHTAKGHSAVWAGTEMIVWGGIAPKAGPVAALVSDGARYDPTTNTWRAVPASGSPGPRSDHAAVWTGREMIVWGGFTNYAGQAMVAWSGGIFTPETNTWSTIPPYDLMPDLQEYWPGQEHFSAHWTGRELLVWGGYAPSAQIRFDASAHRLRGARFNPRSSLWVPLPLTDAPTEAVEHTAVWTGNALMVLGWHRTDQSDDEALHYAFSLSRYEPPSPPPSYSQPTPTPGIDAVGGR
jgi:S1-C subfamily serine protease